MPTDTTNWSPWTIRRPPTCFDPCWSVPFLPCRRRHRHRIACLPFVDTSTYSSMNSYRPSAILPRKFLPPTVTVNKSFIAMWSPWYGAFAFESHPIPPFHRGFFRGAYISDGPFKGFDGFDGPFKGFDETRWTRWTRWCMVKAFRPFKDSLESPPQPTPLRCNSFFGH